MKEETKATVSLAMRTLCVIFLALNIVVLGSFTILVGYDNLFVQQREGVRPDDRGVYLVITYNLDTNEEKIVRIFLDGKLADRVTVPSMEAGVGVVYHIPFGNHTLNTQVCDSLLGTPILCSDYEQTKNFGAVIGYIEYVVIVDDEDG